MEVHLLAKEALEHVVAEENLCDGLFFSLFKSVVVNQKCSEAC